MADVADTDTRPAMLVRRGDCQLGPWRNVAPADLRYIDSFFSASEVVSHSPTVAAHAAHPGRPVNNATNHQRCSTVVTVSGNARVAPPLGCVGSSFVDPGWCSVAASDLASDVWAAGFHAVGVRRSSDLASKSRVSASACFCVCFCAAHRRKPVSASRVILAKLRSQRELKGRRVTSHIPPLPISTCWRRAKKPC